MACAKTSLPTPVSPRSSTVAPVGATWSTCEQGRLDRGTLGHNGRDAATPRAGATPYAMDGLP